MLVGRPEDVPAPSADPLPLRCDVILRDDVSKATGMHIAVLAPASTCVLEYPAEVCGAQSPFPCFRPTLSYPPARPLTSSL